MPPLLPNHPTPQQPLTQFSHVVFPSTLLCLQHSGAFIFLPVSHLSLSLLPISLPLCSFTPPLSPLGSPWGLISTPYFFTLHHLFIQIPSPTAQDRDSSFLQMQPSETVKGRRRTESRGSEVGGGGEEGGKLSEFPKP